MYNKNNISFFFFFFFTRYPFGVAWMQVDRNLTWSLCWTKFPKRINPEYSLEGEMLMLKLQCFGNLIGRANSLEKTLMLGKIEGKIEGGSRACDGWMASLTPWTRVRANSEDSEGQGSLACWVHGVTESDVNQWDTWHESQQNREISVFTYDKSLLGEDWEVLTEITWKENDRKPLLVVKARYPVWIYIKAPTSHNAFLEKWWERTLHKLNN